MEEEAEKGVSKGKIREKVSQEQIHGLLFQEKLSWQSIIFDLIRTEQLDPWDIDIALLSSKYLEKVKLLEEANFFVSSQVLLAAALLLRLKSDILLHEYLPSLDALLFRKEPQKKYVQERIELGEDVPGLISRTPLPRFRKVTLDELMNALGHAIRTENRRIKKVVLARQQEYEMAAALPKANINIKDKIRVIYSRLKNIFSTRENKIAFSEFASGTREEKISTFVPLLHLDHQQRIWLEQEKPFGEIWILLKHLYEKQNAEMLKIMRKEAEEAIGKLTEEEKARAEQVERDFQNPIEDAKLKD
jgi:segregation and condensation protein A